MASLLRPRTVSSRSQRRDTMVRRALRIESLESRRLLAVIGNNLSVGDQLRNYRIAIATTAEYTAAQGGPAAALASVQSLVANLNEIFEPELAIHFDLISNNSEIIFTDTTTDGFDDGNNLGLLLLQNQGVIDGAIGNANYDIGHVLGVKSSGSEGRATLNSAGVDSIKANGASITAYPNSSGWVSLVGHEIGHQFGAQHTFNANAFDSCAGTRSSGNAYEPASGSTIMSYAGICGVDDLQRDEDPVFHSASFEQIETHVRGAGAPDTTTNNSNSIPTVAGGNDFTIPARTPFELTATGADTDNGDTLTYSWEQLDLGAARSLPLNGTDPSGPLFRAFLPTTNPSRTFPRLNDLLAGTDTAPIGEVLPTVTRPINARVTVRDGNGGINSDDVLVNVHDTGSAFEVTTPNASVNWAGGSSQTITWAVANTELAPINAANVDILLSTDGGQSFPITLATTTNDGSHEISAPNLNTTDARIKIQGSGNIFFDISDANFSITADVSEPGITVTESAGNTLVTEDGGVDSYDLNLNTAPAGVVSITVATDSQTLLSADGLNFAATQELAFDSTTPQTIFVRAIDDSVDEGGHAGTITHSITSSTSGSYPVNTLINQVTPQITDNEVTPVVGVDFDFVASGLAPTNWAHFQLQSIFDPQVLSDLQRDDGVTTDFDLTMQLDPLGFFSSRRNAGANPQTKPQHIPVLNEIDGFNRATIPMTATWSDLVPGRSYGVYVFGLDGDQSRDLGQTVTITGSTALPPFTQTLPDGQLAVNGMTGSNSQSLQSFESVVRADSGGEITVRVVPTDDGFGIAGLALREILPTTPGITLTRSVNETSVSEAGGTDTYTLALNSMPGGPVTITVDADADTEISLDGIDFASSRTLDVVNTLPQTITVRAIDDTFIESTHTSTLTHKITASASDAYPLTLNLDSLPVTVSDNDAAPPVIGIDFDVSSAFPPANWTLISDAFGSSHIDLPFEDGTPSSVDLGIAVNGGAAVFPSSDPTVVPIHTPLLTSLGGGRLSTNSITSTFSDLTPGTLYNLYVFGREDFSDIAVNTVTITGATTLPSFVQNTTNKNGVLFVNAGEAEADLDLESYAITAAADGNGEIQILAQNTDTTPGQDRVYLAGLGIQQAPPALTGVTVTETGGTALTEGGPTDTYDIALDTTPTGAVEITVTADAQSQVSLNGTDFASQVTFSRTDTSAQTITVRAVDDSILERSHVSRITAAVTGTINDPNYSATTYVAPVTAIITDNDASAISIAAVDAEKLEGNAGTTNFTFSLTRTGNTSGSASVDYVVSGIGGSPADAGDFGGVFPAATIVFLDGESTRPVSVLVVGDVVPESDEGFQVTLSGALNSTVGTATAAGTILDDDTKPSVQSVTVNDGTIQRSQVTSVTVVFDSLVEHQALSSAFRVTQSDDNLLVGTVAVDPTDANAQTTAVLTFSGLSTIDRQGEGLLGDSLADGNYLLEILATNVRSVGGAQMGQDYRFGETANDKFFRFLGDSDGDRDVDGQDYGRFGLAFLKSSSQEGYDPDFDSDGDGDIDGQDYGRFGLNFLKTL